MDILVKKKKLQKIPKGLRVVSMSYDIVYFKSFIGTLKTEKIPSLLKKSCFSYISLSYLT